jgi:glycosyltransferase involved in cell wall biosynthesis
MISPLKKLAKISLVFNDITTPMPCCSIIIPTCNSGKTISRCLDSIVRQTWGDFEILIVDGMSTDETLDTAKRYAADDPRIRLISEKDKGIYDAMNKGIDLSKGDWLYFLGSDDRLYDNEVLFKVFSDLSNHGVDVLYGNVVSPPSLVSYDGEFTQQKLLNRNISHQAIFFRKEVFQKAGKYDLRYKGYADWDHNFRWFLSDRYSKKYIDLVVAEFTMGGYSNLSEDTAFKRVRVLNFLRSGKKTLSMNEKIRLLKSYCGYALMKKDAGLMARIIFYFPSIILG